MSNRPVCLVTGASRKQGIGAAIAVDLAQAGWDVAITYWQPYDESMPWASHPADAAELLVKIQNFAPDSIAIESDLSQTESPKKIFDFVEANLSTVNGLIMSHCLSIDSDILNTTIELFDQHFAINARATWLMVKEFGSRFQGKFGSG
ncbi:MAG: SDR family oxidoreductase, partial [Chloroflexota bacterium]